MFEARISRGSTWKKILDVFKVLKGSVPLECHQNGISINAMDPSHVSLHNLYLSAGGFSKYICHREFSLGVQVESFAKLMKCADNDDEVTLLYEEGSDYLTLKFESKNQQRISEYELKLVDLEVDKFSIPDTEYCSIVRMPSAEFQRICRDMHQFGDSVSISCTKEGVRFSTNGDLGTGHIHLKESGNILRVEDAVSFVVNEPVCQSFSLKYLIFATRATPLCDHVTLSLSKDMPIAIEYRVPGHGYVRIYVAPRLESMDDEV